MAESPYIVTVDSTNFVTAVIESSQKVPVLVDFWADWCSPCKMLMPILEKLVAEYQGQFILAKINIDQQPALANQFAVRSVPTIKLFRHGKVVDEMLGVQGEAALRTMIDTHRDRPADDLRRQAAQAYHSGQLTAAVELLQAACELDKTYYPSYLDLAQVFLAMGQIETAEAIIKELPATIQAEVATQKLQVRLNFTKVAQQAPTIEQLQATLANDPNQHEARYQLSALLVLKQDYEGALTQLLELMRRGRKFGDDAGRRGLVDVFLLLNNEGSLVSRYRAKMTSLLY
ncbi:thioredoxin [Thioflexithrix psekupsensis]|uniref:Thioredoxin n=1 Tax=Thioflexithrix psekupsensis TaxID=1570016 RepID=A0A251X735_9GAMM|nr:thioredoxin [Thioflexithrix psekupsensis]OUD13140.1 thioredoxin [Thioflexithrix psekupsensis]